MIPVAEYDLDIYMIVAVEDLKAGAYDYLTKPLDFDVLKLTIERALEHIGLKEENKYFGF